MDNTVTIAKQIAEALEAGHEAGVAHRDLKPANIKCKTAAAALFAAFALRR